VEACPNRIISPAFGEYGAANLMLPVIHYKKQFCGFNCNVCSSVCPNGALKPLTVEEKRKVQIGRVEFIAKNCIVFKHKTDCGACDEHCPTKAITMKEWKGRPGLYFPTVNPDMCIGCGGCEYVCPEMPKAMVIRPLSVHGEAIPPKEDKQEKVEISDFGF
jgi:Pyruvate/2-oxoacid:ferredoxin oxidoreductase delta subunit